MITPDTFVPAAEDSGLIFALDAWVLREACAQAAAWPKPLQIAVNLSPLQFRRGDLVGLVRSTLADTGLAANRLELEITESVLIDDFERASEILGELKSLGVRIALDDFGTGFSSLSYLQSFPFDKIKIDRSFVSNLPSNERSASIVRSIIALGHGFKVPILAEGVETEEQFAFLAAEACDEAQGYLLGRPAALQDYADLNEPAPCVRSPGETHANWQTKRSPNSRMKSTAAPSCCVSPLLARSRHKTASAIWSL
jgi:EAL domain-containing protein (putative c-di-GMP-specific phosphodiesterase class I)